MLRDLRIEEFRKDFSVKYKHVFSIVLKLFKYRPLFIFRILQYMENKKKKSFDYDKPRLII